MKKTIKYRTTLMAAALLGAPSAWAADCLFVPPTESVKIRNLEPSFAYSV